MDQSSWVIAVLDDSNRRSIEYQNRFQLRQNVDKLHIQACIEDCTVNIFNITQAWTHEGTILIQEGKNIQFLSDFNPEKEALLLTKHGSLYMFFLYSP